jgi:hypothetical protein
MGLAKSSNPSASTMTLMIGRKMARSADLPAARDALGRWLVGYGVVLAILAFALWDMTFKPGA